MADEKLLIFCLILFLCLSLKNTWHDEDMLNARAAADIDVKLHTRKKMKNFAADD